MLAVVSSQVSSAKGVPVGAEAGAGAPGTPPPPANYTSLAWRGPRRPDELFGSFCHAIDHLYMQQARLLRQTRQLLNHCLLTSREAGVLLHKHACKAVGPPGLPCNQELGHRSKDKQTNEIGLKTLNRGTRRPQAGERRAAQVCSPGPGTGSAPARPPV